LEEKVAASVKKAENTAVAIRRAGQATPFYLQKLALASPISGSLSVSIVRSWTQATEIFFQSYYYDWNRWHTLCRTSDGNPLCNFLSDSFFLDIFLFTLFGVVANVFPALSSKSTEPFPHFFAT
jgi:hypothetical protein